MTVQCNKPNCKQKIKDIYICQSTCKCGLIYCYEHIQSRTHNCNIDYLELHKNTIKFNNQKCIGNKVIKI